MAKVTLTIEDLPDGKVKVTSDPKMEVLIKMEVSGYGLSSAEGYAFACLNKIREISKSNSADNKIIIPRLR